MNPPSGIRNRWPFALVIALVLLITWRFYRASRQTERSLDSLEDPHTTETPDTRAARLRALAPDALRAACLKVIPGFTRIIDPSLDSTDQNPNNWTAAPTMEFVNTTGGIERTNLPFAFAVQSGELNCEPDLAKISADEKARFDAEIKRLSIQSPDAR